MRIVCVQSTAVTLDAWPDTLKHIESAAASAAEHRPDLILFPEGAFPTYGLRSAAAHRDMLRAGMPSHEDFLDRCGAMARRQKVCIAIGFIEDTDSGLANAAAFIDRAGRVLHIHRKLLRWDFDNELFVPGDTLAAFDTEFGRIGLMICADARLPEVPASLVADGARLLLQPTAWVNSATADDPTTLPMWNAQPSFLIPSRAAELGVPIASASKVGIERGTQFVGRSLICDGDGASLASATGAQPALVVAEVELPAAAKLEFSSDERDALCAPGDATPRPTQEAARYCRLQITRRRPAAAPQPALDTSQIEVTPTSVESTGLRAGRHVTLELPAAGRFAPARCAVLNGADIVFVRAAAPPTRMQVLHLRTRAAENRVFLIAADPVGVRVWDPRGLLLDDRRWPERDTGAAPPIQLDLRLAADKCVAPGTDVIAARTPRLYRF